MPTILLLTFSNIKSWDVLSFPAIAQQDETYDFLTPYGRRQIHRSTGEILQPALLSPTSFGISATGND